MRPVSTLSVCNELRRRSPNGSLPTRPAIATGAPRRLIATAWLAPFPPGTSLREPAPSSVSPNAGIRGTRTTWSMLRLPTTRILLFAISISLLFPLLPAAEGGQKRLLNRPDVILHRLAYEGQ